MAIAEKIRFQDAKKMQEISDQDASLVYVTPPYVGHHAIAERQSEQELLKELIGEGTRVLKDDGVLVSYNTDFYLRGGVYPRHDVIIKAAETNNLELYAQRIFLKKEPWKRDKFRMTYSHVMVFIKEGTKPEVRQRNQRIPEYEADVWANFINQNILDFKDAVPPEAAIIPIKNFTQNGELVVSSCAGSGTICIAADRLGRETIGYEIDSGRLPIIEHRENQFDSYLDTNPTSRAILEWLSKS